MSMKTAETRKYFGVMQGLSSIGQIWPSGQYEEYLPSQSQQVRISQYWNASGEYLKQAEAQVKANIKAQG
ncbi:MAG: hypothetical protein IBX50_16920 [Marinospirillum sp.]|uniref:hypothetical protein n=1 Tax=Marinospirillum sp. TaxID=2183934 RepID=UPI0019E9EBE2|nr:hypothetical protein [Marinospirillum sp.]MBE0508373.1 hypothetical protein [Marinospirillum sp.]